MKNEKSMQGEAFEFDGSDGRDYLAGQPLHCGTSLKLQRGGEWVWARYEMFSDTRRGYLVDPYDKIVLIDGTERARWPESWER